MNQKIVTVLAFAASLALVPAANAQVNIGINIGVPAPPPVIVAPPRLVLVPGTPVSYAPAATFNVFVYGGRYYSFHDGVWFSATAPGAPWVVIQTERVPHVVRGVPVTYYKVPPGHAKRMRHDGPPAPGGPSGCPPGLAKKGRC
jgi:hypothetical protein